MPASTTAASRETPGDDFGPRAQLLAALPVTENCFQLAGFSTPVLHGGNGPPVVLLHGPAGYAAHWVRVIPELVTTCQVVAPDLPGHGACDAGETPLNTQSVLAWLDELIERTCTSPPVLVGQLLGGAIAARFACGCSHRIRGLVLVDTFGLAAFQPEPQFAQALNAFFADPTQRSHRNLWQQCAFDLSELQRQFGALWGPFEAYNLERARTASVLKAVHASMQHFGAAAIPAKELGGISAPTSLIWGRHDRATPLQTAEAASKQYGWPLTVIERAADDPVVEQPEAFVRVLRRILGERP